MADKIKYRNNRTEITNLTKQYYYCTNAHHLLHIEIFMHISQFINNILHRIHIF